MNKYLQGPPLYSQLLTLHFIYYLQLFEILSGNSIHKGIILRFHVFNKMQNMQLSIYTTNNGCVNKFLPN